MKYKKYKYLVVSALLALTFTQQCTDLNDQLDPDAIQEDKVFEQLSNAEAVVISGYARMPLGSQLYAQALISDELKVGAQNNGQGVQLNSWSFTSGDDEFAAVWYGAYRAIQGVNKFLLNYEKIEALTPDEIALKERLKGEALALRAFNHYLLIRNFSPKYSPSALGVPFVTTDDVTAQPSRPTMQETYSLIMNDLNEAYPLLEGFSSKIRFTQAAIRSLQAYVALETGDFTGAITYANQALAFNSVLVPTAQFSAMWTDSNDVEIIFEQKSTPSSLIAAPGAYFLTSQLSDGGLMYYNPSTKIYAAYDPGDVRRARYFSGNPNDFSTFFINKYPGSTGNWGVNDIKVFRVADLHLVKAEAYAKMSTPNLIEAYNSYQIVRTARNAGTSNPFSTSAEAVSEIIEERFREFAWEGSRLTDLKRNDMQVVRNTVDTHPSNPATTLTQEHRYVFPIPTAEILANPNMDQNPGY